MTSRRAATARFRDHLQVPLPVRFDAGAFPRVAFGEEAFDVGAGLEPFGRRPAIEALAGGGSQPGAQRHALGARLMREPGVVLVRNQQLHSGHFRQNSMRMLMKNPHPAPSVVDATLGAAGSRRMARCPC